MLIKDGKLRKLLVSANMLPREEGQGYPGGTGNDSVPFISGSCFSAQAFNQFIKLKVKDKFMRITNQIWS